MFPVVRCQSSVVTKKETAAALKSYAYNLAMIIAGVPTVTAAQKLELGIRPRATRTPIPAPISSPLVDVAAVNGRTVTFKMHTAGRRGRPVGVRGASFFTYMGDASPIDPTGWVLQGLISKTKFNITFDGTAPAVVWVTANWYSGTGQTGTACQPVSVNLPATNSLPQTEIMKIAA